MAFHKHTSWGRTRSPKNILSNFRAGTDDSGTVLTVATATSDAYTTENQRYLIIHLKTYNTSFQVEGYMHASGEWADLKGSTINAVGIWIVEIGGIDKVRFTTGGSCTLFAACSTF